MKPPAGKTIMVNVMDSCIMMCIYIIVGIVRIMCICIMMCNCIAMGIR